MLVFVSISTRLPTSTWLPIRFSSGTRDSSAPPGVISIDLESTYTKFAIEYWYTLSSTLRLSSQKYMSALTDATGL